MSTETRILERLREMESQMTFQDELHGQLNDIVARQNQEISQLKEQVTELARRLREIDVSMSGQQSGPVDDLPPHY